MSLESKDSAKRRHEMQLQSGTKKPKNHIGNLHNVSWDDEVLAAEVNAKSSDEVVNWNELARKYNITDKSSEIANNGGQIVKESLRKKGVDVDCLKMKGCDNGPRIRKKRRLTGG